jgi:hypothetical protein
MVSIVDGTAVKFTELLSQIQIHQFQIPLQRFAEMIPKINTSENFNLGGVWQDEISAIAIPWRKALMATNTAKMYCADLQTHKNLPLVLRVGSNHVEGLIRQLKAMAGKSGLNPNLIKTRKPILTKQDN